jgi:hypothetical protein
MNTRIQTTDTGLFRDATALMGSGSVVQNYGAGCKFITDPLDLERNK